MRRKAVFLYMVNTVLAMCLALILLLFSGLTQGERTAMNGLKQLGKPYVFNTAGPEKFDCSGLVMWCTAAEGLGELPHEARLMYEIGLPIQRWQLLPGDWVCFDTVRDKDPSDHIGIWIGGNCFVHASSSKHKVVVSELEGYYLEKCSGARRYANPYL